MKYKVLLNIKHDGDEYAPGTTIELDEAQATRLIEAGVISDGSKAEQVAPEEEQEQAPELPEQPIEPKVGGEPTQSGEPSLDGNQPEKKDTATDVTPVVVEAHEGMKRDKLEAIAQNKGVDEAAIKAAPNKRALVDLITGKKEGSEDETPDPSANL